MAARRARRAVRARNAQRQNNPTNLEGHYRRRGEDLLPNPRELSVLDAAARRVEILKKTIADNQRAEQLLRSEQGAKLVKSSFEGIWAIIQDVLCAKSEDSASLKFHCRRSFDTSMYVSTVRG